MKLLPIAFPVHEFMTDDVRLEHAGVLEQSNVPRDDVADSHREGEDQLREREFPNLGAGVHALAGDAGHVLRKVPVDGLGELSPGHAFIGVNVVESGREPLDLISSSFVGHPLKALDVRSKLEVEVDPLHLATTHPVLHCAAGVHAERRGAEDSSGKGRAEKEPRCERCGGHDVGQRDRSIGRVVGNSDLFHGCLYGREGDEFHQRKTPPGRGRRNLHRT